MEFQGITNRVHLPRIKTTPPPESSQDTEDLGQPEESRWMSEPLQDLMLLFQEGQRNFIQGLVRTATISPLPSGTRAPLKLSEMLWWTWVCIVLLTLLLALKIFYKCHPSSVPLPEGNLCTGFDSTPVNQLEGLSLPPQISRHPHLCTYLSLHF